MNTDDQSSSSKTPLHLGHTLNHWSLILFPYLDWAKKKTHSYLTNYNYQLHGLDWFFHKEAVNSNHSSSSSNEMKKHSYHSVSSHLWWVPAVPEATIQSWQFVHVCITEWKVKQLRVPLNPVGVGWFGEHRDTLLHSPAQQYLIKTHTSIWGEP